MRFVVLLVVIRRGCEPENHTVLAERHTRDISQQIDLAESILAEAEYSEVGRQPGPEQAGDGQTGRKTCASHRNLLFLGVNVGGRDSGRDRGRRGSAGSGVDRLSPRGASTPPHTSVPARRVRVPPGRALVWRAMRCRGAERG